VYLAEWIRVLLAHALDSLAAEPPDLMVGRDDAVFPYDLGRHSAGYGGSRITWVEPVLTVDERCGG
jgi:hypothetical protein